MNTPARAHPTAGLPYPRRMTRLPWACVLLLACSSPAVNERATETSGAEHPSRDPSAEQVPSEQGPDADGEPVPSDAPRVEATPLRGPFATPCEAATQEEAIPCGQLRTIAETPARRPFRTVRFAELLFEEEMPDSACLLLLETGRGWFAHTLDGMLCGNSGSVRLSVGARFGWHTIGPGGAPRLEVRVEQDYSHSTDGEEARADLLLCGVDEGGVPRCLMWWVSQEVIPFEEMAELSEVEAVSWTAPLGFEPTDVLTIGAFERPEFEGNHPLPNEDRVQLDFGD